MTCKHVAFPGGHGVICSRGRARRRCRFCGEFADRQCDYPLRGLKAGRTCSAYVCTRCAPDRLGAGGEPLNYCPPHARMDAAKPKPKPAQPEPEQLTLEAVK